MGRWKLRKENIGRQLCEQYVNWKVSRHSNQLKFNVKCCNFDNVNRCTFQSSYFFFVEPMAKMAHYFRKKTSRDCSPNENEICAVNSFSSRQLANAKRFMQMFIWKIYNNLNKIHLCRHFMWMGPELDFLCCMFHSKFYCRIYQTWNEINSRLMWAGNKLSDCEMTEMHYGYRIVTSAFI